MARHTAILSSFVLLLAATTASCTVENGDGAISDDESAAEQAQLDGKADGAATTSTYYTIRPDLRRCVAPLCGGDWVARVNRSTTRCADGHNAAECYVASIDWGALAGADLSGPLVVRAEMGTRDWGGSFGAMGELRVSEAWRAPTDAAPDGYFYRLTDNGIRCVRAPCFSTHEAKLNSTVDREISDIDLTGSGATDDQIAEALGSLADGGLLAAGTNYRLHRGVTLVAAQFYTRVTVDPLFCQIDADCGWTAYPRPVTSSSDCYCDVCADSVSSVAAATANEASWQTYCSDVHLVCPLRACVLHPDPTCVDNRCTAP